MTSLGDAFTSAGLIPRDYALGAAIIQFKKLGGNPTRAVEIVCLAFAAKQMPGEGQTARASDGQIPSVRPRQPVEDVAAHAMLASNGQMDNGRPSSFNRGGDGQNAPVREDLSTGAIPVREPAPKQKLRTAEEKTAAKRAMVITADAIYHIKIGTKSLGNLAWDELMSLKDKYVHDAAANLMRGVAQVETAILLELVVEHCVPVTGNSLVKDLIAAGKLTQLKQRATRLAPQRVKIGMERAADAFAQRELAR